MIKRPIFIAFSTQKGGVGKSVFSVLAASYLHYKQNYNVVFVDCDYPQSSLLKMRQRDLKGVEQDELIKVKFARQLNEINKPPYPILCSSPEQAIDITNTYLDSCDEQVDIVFIDLPGTVLTEGVLRTISQIDYIFTPITADRIVLESSIAFAMAVDAVLIGADGCYIKSVHLFWNKINRRESTDIYDLYNKRLRTVGLSVLDTYIPDTARFKKEYSTGSKRQVFRSTIFPYNPRVESGTNFKRLLVEIMSIIKLELK